MAKFYAQKNGRVYNVYTTPFSKWDEVPEEFPRTYPGIEDVSQLHAELGTTDVTVIDRPAAPAPAKQEAGLPLGALLAGLAKMGLPPEKIAEVEQRRAPALSQADREEFKQVNMASDLQVKMLQEFRIVVAENRKDNPADIEAIGSFILSVCPDLEEDLRKIVKEPTRQRFSL